MDRRIIIGGAAIGGVALGAGLFGGGYSLGRSSESSDTLERTVTIGTKDGGTTDVSVSQLLEHLGTLSQRPASCPECPPCEAAGDDDTTPGAEPVTLCSSETIKGSEEYGAVSTQLGECQEALRKARARASRLPRLPTAAQVKGSPTYGRLAGEKRALERQLGRRDRTIAELTAERDECRDSLADRPAAPTPAPALPPAPEGLDGLAVNGGNAPAVVRETCPGSGSIKFDYRAGNRLGRIDGILDGNIGDIRGLLRALQADIIARGRQIDALEEAAKGECPNGERYTTLQRQIAGLRGQNIVLTRTINDSFVPSLYRLAAQGRHGQIRTLFRDLAGNSRGYLAVNGADGMVGMLQAVGLNPVQTPPVTAGKVRGTVKAGMLKTLSRAYERTAGTSCNHGGICEPLKERRFYIQKIER